MPWHLAVPSTLSSRTKLVAIIVTVMMLFHGITVVLINRSSQDGESFVKQRKKTPATLRKKDNGNPYPRKYNIKALPNSKGKK